MTNQQNSVIDNPNQLQMVSDNIFVRGIKETVVGGVLKGQSADDRPGQGEVLSVGGDVKEISVGQTILFNKYLATRFDIGGKKYYSLKMDDVIGYKKS